MPDYFLSPAQCRMARALLNWTQPALAERCGLAPMTISKFEKEEGGYNPEARTLKKIMSVFEMSGVVFTQSGGVEPINNLVTILEGEDANNRLLDDIFNTLKDTGGEVLIAGLREVSKSEEKAYEFLREHLKRLMSAGISERTLLEDGDENMVAPAEWYRYLPKGCFTDSPFQLYGDNLALIQWGPPQHIILIKHKLFAQTFRNLFDIVWEQAKPANTGKS